MRKVPESILRAVVYQRLQAGMPFQRVLPAFEIERRDREVPNWRVQTTDQVLAAVVRDLQGEFDLSSDDHAIPNAHSLDRVSPPPLCPRCDRRMRRSAYLRSESQIPALSEFRCDECGIERTFEEDD
jgi:hypothetical protein